MNPWGGRLALFLAVLAVVLFGAQAVRRWTTEASMRIPRAALSRPAMSQPGSRARVVAAGLGAAADVDSSAAPQSDLKADPVLSAEGPKIAPAEPQHVAAAAAALQQSQPTRTFHDPRYKVSFDYPASWTFTQRDGEISTFRFDARSAPKNTSLRAVAALPANPYPASTFSGGYVYLSVTPHSNASRCAAQAAPAGRHQHPANSTQIAGVPFAHGHDEQKEICTVERDEIYTTFRQGACYRFDLAMNNFCGGEVSGVKDVTQQELDSVLARLQAVVETVRFDPK